MNDAARHQRTLDALGRSGPSRARTNRPNCTCSARPTYTDDIAELAGTLHAALGLSSQGACAHHRHRPGAGPRQRAAWSRC